MRAIESAKPAVGKILAKGQLTIPQDIRTRVHAEPGSLVRFSVVGPSRFEVEIIPRSSLQELWRKYPLDTPIDLSVIAAESEAALANAVITEIENNGE